MCGAHGCWLTPQHLFPSLIPIWSSAVPGTPTPRSVPYLAVSALGSLLYSQLNAETSKACKAQQGLVHITPTSSPSALPTAFTICHLPLQPPHCFLSTLGRCPTLPPSISLNKTCEGPDGVEHFSLNPSFFFHTERTFQQNQINFRHSLLNASRGVCTNILPWQEFWRMCIEPFFLGSERTMCNSVVEKALLKAIEGGIFWVGFQILLHLHSVSCSADSHLMKA